MRAGTRETRLIVLRGNSASGKSTVAASLRDRFGRGLALVAQDNLRRQVLRERDRPGAAPPSETVGPNLAVQIAGTNGANTRKTNKNGVRSIQDASKTGRARG